MVFERKREFGVKELCELAKQRKIEVGQIYTIKHAAGTLFALPAGATLIERVHLLNLNCGVPQFETMGRLTAMGNELFNLRYMVEGGYAITL